MFIYIKSNSLRQKKIENYMINDFIKLSMYTDPRSYRKKVFLETDKFIKQFQKQAPFNLIKGKKINAPSGKPEDYNTQLTPTQIEVIDMDTLDAVELYSKLDKTTYCFLNMASSNPRAFGGGYRTGASAQEEDLCRRSNLCQAFYMMKPPVPPKGGCFVENVTILRKTMKHEYGWLEKDEWLQGNCIMCAASRNPEVRADGTLAPKYYEEMREKIRSMLQICLQENQTYLILGAFGCGAYGNPPQDVAKIFKNFLTREFKDKFNRVVFAIVDNRYTRNKEVFQNVLLGKTSPVTAITKSSVSEKITIGDYIPLGMNPALAKKKKRRRGKNKE